MKAFDLDVEDDDHPHFDFALFLRRSLNDLVYKEVENGACEHRPAYLCFASASVPLPRTRPRLFQPHRLQFPPFCICFRVRPFRVMRQDAASGE